MVYSTWCGSLHPTMVPKPHDQNHPQQLLFMYFRPQSRYCICTWHPRDIETQIPHLLGTWTLGLERALRSCSDQGVLGWTIKSDTERFTLYRERVAYLRVYIYICTT